MRKHLCGGQFEDCTACILDLRKRQLIDAQGDPAAMDLLLLSEYGSLDTYFKALDDAAEKAA